MMALVDTGSQISSLIEGYPVQKWVEDPSTEELDKGCVASQGDGAHSNTIQRICRG